MLAPDLPRQQLQREEPILALLSAEINSQAGLASICLLNAFKKDITLSNKNKGKSKLQWLRGVFG